MQDSRSLYTDDQIQALLKKAFESERDVELLTPMMGNEWSTKPAQGRNQTLRSNLSDAFSSRDLRGKKIVAPINLGMKSGQGIHWVLLYVTMDNSNRVNSVHYVDPLGNEMPDHLWETLKSSFSIPEDQKRSINQSEKKYQKDRYNCGPWVVELAKYLVQNNGTFPDEKAIDIQSKRREHAGVLEKAKSSARVELVEEAASPAPAAGAFFPPQKARFTQANLIKTLREVFNDGNLSIERSPENGSSEKIKARIEDKGQVFNFEQTKRYCELATLGSDEEVLKKLVAKTVELMEKLGMRKEGREIEVQTSDPNARKILLEACSTFNLNVKGEILSPGSFHPFQVL